MPQEIKSKVAVIGATGYTGLETVRLVLQHPHMELFAVTSESSAGKKLSEVYPHLQGVTDLVLQSFEKDKDQIIQQAHTLFLALPHGTTQAIVQEISKHQTTPKLIDLSGDFRLKDAKLYEQYYGKKHDFPEGLGEFVYGLPEANKEDIRSAKNVANPGCFATAAQLALLPLKGNIKHAEVFAVTGSSGSGKEPKESTHHPVRNHNVKSYKIGSHQHIPEVLQTSGLTAEQLSFVPTSGPFVRGIHLTAFIELEKELDEQQVKKLFETEYADDPFVRIKDQVELAAIVGSNFCDLSVQAVNGRIVVQAVIDNLVKGAAGTAVHNFNLMQELPETTGLEALIPLYP
ncbi:MAG: N-acetyl-gamma-glutamyl-phosphate reductase [bacterium]|nr:N-acetyl-gamma-glutamyl-phosphate reductase [bacterium]